MANTSVATVSRAFSNKPGVSDAERLRILALAKEVGYQPNRIAQNLALQKSHLIGLVASDLYNEAYVRFLRKVQHTIEPLNYQVLIADSERAVSREMHHISIMQQHQAEGLMIFPVHDWDNRTPTDHLHALKSSRQPFVVIGSIEGADFDSVTSDEVEAAKSLTRHLIGLGHHDIAFVARETTNRVVMERLAGVEEAMMEAGLKLKAENILDYHENWMDDLRAMLFRHDRPGALVMMNDVMALLAWPIILRMNLKVPADLSLVAFGDSVWASHNVPAITTTFVNLEEVAQLAIEMLLARIESPAKPAQHRRVPQQLRLRESTGPLAK